MYVFIYVYTYVPVCRPIIGIPLLAGAMLIALGLAAFGKKGADARRATLASEDERRAYPKSVV
jgi:hypothetical protein